MSKYKNISDLFSGKTILITGGTGSFGQTFARCLCDNIDFKKLIIFSRDEMKQWEMAKSYHNDPRVRFLIGDVRDKNRLSRAMNDVDYVIHAAATKIVPIAEYNPFECIKTNVNGAMNVIEAALDNGVKSVVALSTDKACSPINLYGASKLASDKLFIAGNSYSNESGTRFAVVRYGNVMGSRGSVIPLFLKQRQSHKLSITDSRMTRFMITLQEGIDLVFKSFVEMQGGEIFIHKCPSMKVVDIARTIAPDAELENIGIRPGEKLHEVMISAEDSANAREFDDHYVIFPEISSWSRDLSKWEHGRELPDQFVYSSDNNKDWMSEYELKLWLEKNQGKMLEI